MLKSASGQKQIIVGMGTCGIAAGARETMKAILEKIETDELSGIDCHPNRLYWCFVKWSRSCRSKLADWRKNYLW